LCRSWRACCWSPPRRARGERCWRCSVSDRGKAQRVRAVGYGIVDAAGLWYTARASFPAPG
jgi:hypothetical protein